MSEQPEQTAEPGDAVPHILRQWLLPFRFWFTAPSWDPSTGPRDVCDPFAWQANGDSLPSDHRARGSKQFCRLPSTSQPRPLEPPTVCGPSAVHHRFEVRARRLRRDRHGRPLACSDHCLLRSALADRGHLCRNTGASWRGNTTAVERQSHHANDSVAAGVLQSRHTLGMRSARRQRFFRMPPRGTRKHSSPSQMPSALFVWSCGTRTFIDNARRTPKFPKFNQAGSGA